MKRMSMILIPSMALLAAGVAQAQPVQAQPQAAQAQPQAKQQPASTPASAAQINKCSQIGSNVLDNMKNGHFSKASASFESSLGVDKSKLQKMWGQLTGKFGNLKSAGKAAQGRQIKGYTVILMPVSFDKGDLAAQVACDSKGTVADLRFGQMPGSKTAPASSKS